MPEDLERKRPEEPKEKIVVQATDADTILSCLAGNQKMSRKELSEAYKAALLMPLALRVVRSSA